MSKGPTIYSSYDCDQKCNIQHNTKQPKHNVIELKRMKTQIDQFLSIDDWMWEGAIALEYKLEELESQIRELKKKTIESIYDKKLLYALGWDNSNNLPGIFKQARDGNFSNLTCKQISRIHDKVSKVRNAPERQTTKITNAIIQDTKREVKELVEQMFSGSIKAEEKQVKRQDRPKRQERQPVKQIQSNNNVINMPENEYQTIKINQINQTEHHFNIFLKVLKIHKQFFMGSLRKIEFLAGDETGTAIAVVNFYDFIRSNNVISISNARTYSFHGIKQIQMSNRNSFINLQQIKINQVNDKANISEKRQNRYRKEGEGYRKPREQGRQVRGQRGGDRGDREDRARRPDRQQREGREQRRERGDRVERGEREERVQRGQRGERIQRENRNFKNRLEINEDQEKKDIKSRRVDRFQESSQQKKPSKKSSEINNNDSNSQDQSPSSKQDKNSAKKGKQVEQKVHPKYTKISKIEPGDQDLTILAQIIEIYFDQDASRGNLLCKIGDDSGVIRAQLPKNNTGVKVSAVVRISKVMAQVGQDRRIRLKIAEDGICEKTPLKLASINDKVDISQQQWFSEQEDEEQQQDQKDSSKNPIKDKVVEDF